MVLRSTLESPKLFGSVDADGNPIRVIGGMNREGGRSTPRTDVGAPKHGKEDDKPHVGGNQWAGGTGGSDTAGLGGRGGRIDWIKAIRFIKFQMKKKQKYLRK